MNKQSLTEISKHQWYIINQMLLDDVRWEYTISTNGQHRRYNFRLEVKSDTEIYLKWKTPLTKDFGADDSETILSTLELGGKLDSVSKHMLKVGWNKWTYGGSKLFLNSRIKKSHKQ